jgi:hypothetical protein
MNVEIGTEAAQFPEKEYINGISLQCRMFISFANIRDVSVTSGNVRIGQIVDDF